MNLLLFVINWTWLDLYPAVAYLSTRLRTPNTRDWDKLERLMGYIDSIVYVPLTFKSDYIAMRKWLIDASYATHGDIKSHTGGMMFFEKGSI